MNPTPAVRLTLDKVVVRVIQAPLRRPIVAKIGEFKSWPFILTDVLTKEGVIGHSYLEAYRVSSTKSIVALIDEMAEQQRGKPVAPFDRFDEAMGSLISWAVGRDAVRRLCSGQRLAMRRTALDARKRQADLLRRQALLGRARWGRSGLTIRRILRLVPLSA